MTKHYAVTITASRAEIDAETYAQRLGELLERSPRELEDALRGDTVVVERGLRYAEAIEIQRELSRRRIPAQVSAREELTGREVLLRGDFFGEELSDLEEVADDPEGDGGGEASDEGRREAASATAEDQKSDAAAESEADDDDPGAWAELFPDLVQEEGQADDEDEDGWSADDIATGPTVREEPAMVASAGPSVAVGNSADGVLGDFAGVEEVGESEGIGADGGPGGESSAVGGSGREGEAGGFDAGKIHAAFSGERSERPPYKPKGYDKRPEHVPLVAALLSAFAPGAGQIFNGQPEKGQRFAVTFFLIYPWVQSVRQAMKYGEKVRTYYAPRPEEGTGKKALLFAAKWWAVVVILAVVCAGLVSMIQDHRHTQAELRYERAVSHAVDAATVHVTRSARSADEAAGEVEIIEEDDDADDSGFTMDDEERAQRLFVIGYHYCKGGNYAMCEQLMGRVTSIKPAHQDAFRIRSWAGVQRNSPDPDRQMPEINGEVPTLGEFERQLALEGMDLEDVDRNFATWWDIEGERRIEEMEQQEQDGAESDRADDARRPVE